MELSQILGWTGTVIGTFVGIPQLVKTIRTKKTGDLSAMTFVLIVATCSCLLARASAIREAAFMFYYTLLIVINSLQIFLIWRYRERKINF
jgi:uncharacterized protein with PQ loop repeat